MSCQLSWGREGPGRSWGGLPQDSAAERSWVPGIHTGSAAWGGLWAGGSSLFS